MVRHPQLGYVGVQYRKFSNTPKNEPKALILVRTKAAKIVNTRRIFSAKNIRKCVCGRGSTAPRTSGVAKVGAITDGVTLYTSTSDDLFG